MPKLHRIAQDQKAPAIKSTGISVMKKQRKKKIDKGSSNGVRKSDSKKSTMSNEMAKNITTQSKQKNKKIKYDCKLDVKDTERLDVSIKMDMDSKIKHNKMKDKFGAKNTAERSDFPTRYLKDDKKTSEVMQKININSETKSTKRGRKRKQDMNLEYANKDTARVDNVKEKKKLQISAKESISFEHKKAKIEKLKKITGKKMKRMSAEADGWLSINTDEILKLNNHIKRIKQLEEMLAKSTLATKQILKGRLISQLEMTRYRFLNEIYNNDSKISKRYFKQYPDACKAYYAIYKWQFGQWMLNPLDVIISSILEIPMDNIIADFGCGEARLDACVPHTVHSFDFIALNDRVQPCNMAHIPLQKESVHVVVFCLSLIGSNINDYIIEANRVLKKDGVLKIAEVRSRFENVKNFIKVLRNYGFKIMWKDFSQNMFYFMDFKKEKAIEKRKKKTLPPIPLKSL
ncbi:PREDICTED: ribosomal RNA-processing protein 8-like [Wasmannia auropunctata]|uniref:ribosomal RNA-processing protein 8-like n=1 Tax=Wasmannia auropunctata TaxID=64793 RepID=UPI0005F016EA|nr:PREDICTED: ribosomal RNA-processing protein 8-like [Wasmannia auropunctata]